MSIDYYTLRHGKWGGVDVIGWGEYPDDSVLAGQTRKTFLDNFESEEAALKEFPTATWSNSWTEPRICLNHDI